MPLDQGPSDQQEELLSSGDELSFFEDDEEVAGEKTEPWKILIVDDEEEIHTVTKMALEDYQLDGRGIEFLSAFSAKEAKELLKQHHEVAVVLLDVVMEDDHAGLELARYIREILRNDVVRIILRTGQPGQAPERQVILDYDINDYKTKTELTSIKLFTIVTASLRAYMQLIRLEKNRRGLEKIIEASVSIFEIQSVESFISGVLTQIASLLNLNNNSLYAHSAVSSMMVECGERDIQVIAGIGEYEGFSRQRLDETMPEQIRHDLMEASRQKQSLFLDNRAVIYFRSKNGEENMLYLEGNSRLGAFDKKMLELFCRNINVAFDNIYLNDEMLRSQNELVYTIGLMSERKPKDQVENVLRLGKYAALLAEKAGLSERQQNVIEHAAPMHDVGMVCVVDDILNKPGTLSGDEWEIVRRHPRYGYDILKESDSVVLIAASFIALQHHERWDGEGYPDGLKGESIQIFARIVALVDVFDTLSNPTVYREAWETEKIVEHIQEEKGRHFDPVLVDIFIQNLDGFIAIRNQFLSD